MECLTEEECAYSLTFSGHSAVQFEAMTSYIYYVSQSNTQMIFRFKNSDKEKIEDNIITLFATGGRNVSIHIADCFDENCDKFNFAEGVVITMKAKDYDYYVLTVDAKVGDYITVRIFPLKLTEKFNFIDQQLILECTGCPIQLKYIKDVHSQELFNLFCQ